jgi:aspartyl-tRNA(Asn)/glutamyl-tRNA(Gln) amidotransferase subunit A
VPLAYKDLCHVPGLPTSCGTRTRSTSRSEIECTAVTRLSAAGAITLGKLNMTELALGPFGDNPHHGDVDNPWKPATSPAGSSSGSGAAVAAGSPSARSAPTRAARSGCRRPAAASSASSRRTGG